MSFLVQFYRRKASLFLLAAASFVTLTGASLAGASQGLAKWLCIFFAAVLVMLIYVFDDRFDVYFDRPNEGLKSLKTQIIFSSALLLTIGIGLFSLTKFGFLAVIAISVLGYIYTIPIPWNGGRQRLKNFYLSKNILIGIGWGILVFLGAGTINDEVIAYFIFVGLQVFIGSSLRDLNDMAVDEKAAVKTLPLVLGEKNTFYVLLLVNLFAGILATGFYTVNWISFAAMLGLLAVVVWRAVILYFYFRRSFPDMVLQTFNFFTCALIYFTRLAAQ